MAASASILLKRASRRSRCSIRPPTRSWPRSRPAYRPTSSICSTAPSSASSWCRDLDRLMLFDPDTNKEVRSIAVGKQPHWAALSPDGKTAYVTNEGSNDMSVVDLESGKVTIVAVGQGPRKLVVQGGVKRAADAGGGARVWLAEFGF